MDTYAFDSLPELPLALFEKAGKLKHAGNAPVLTIVPDGRRSPDPPKTPTEDNLMQRTRVTYATQVLYPKVVCYPTGELFDEVSLDPGNQPEEGSLGDVEAAGGTELQFKLTQLNGEKLKLGHFCTVQSGPWSAVVVEEGPCIDGRPKFFSMAVYALDLVIEWYGEWEDIPSYPNLTVFMNDLHERSRVLEICPGFKYCPLTNSIIPETEECEHDSNV